MRSLFCLIILSFNMLFFSTSSFSGDLEEKSPEDRKLPHHIDTILEEVEEQTDESVGHLKVDALSSSTVVKERSQNFWLPDWVEKEIGKELEEIADILEQNFRPAEMSSEDALEKWKNDLENLNYEWDDFSKMPDNHKTLLLWKQAYDMCNTMSIFFHLIYRNPDAVSYKEEANGRHIPIITLGNSSFCCASPEWAEYLRGLTNNFPILMLMIIECTNKHLVKENFYQDFIQVTACYQDAVKTEQINSTALCVIL